MVQCEGLLQRDRAVLEAGFRILSAHASSYLVLRWFVSLRLDSIQAGPLHSFSKDIVARVCCAQQISPFLRTGTCMARESQTPFSGPALRLAPLWMEMRLVVRIVL